MHRYPYPCTRLAALIVHNLPRNRGKTQHNKFHCLGYLGAVGSEDCRKRTIFLVVCEYEGAYVSLTQSFDCMRGGLNTGLFTITMQNELLRYRGSLLATPNSSTIQIEGFGAKLAIWHSGHILGVEVL